MNSLKPCWFLLHFPSFGGICPFAQKTIRKVRSTHTYGKCRNKRNRNGRKKHKERERERREREGRSRSNCHTTRKARLSRTGEVRWEFSWYEHLWTINTESDRGTELQPKRPANVLLAKCSGRLHARNESLAGSNFHWTAGSSCQPWSQHGKLTKQY